MLIRIIQAILCIGLVLTIHELGHLIAARIVGVRVQRFSVFLSPWFSVVKWKPGKYLKFWVSEKEAHNLEQGNSNEDLNDFDNISPKKWSDTEYVLGWIPIAGYCKFDTQYQRTEREGGPSIYPDWDIRNFQAWKRMFVTLAGIAANIITAGIIFFCLDFFAPRIDYNQIEADSTYVSYSPYAKKIGFKDDDVIIRADSTYIRDGLIDLEPILTANEVMVKRGNDTILINVPAFFADSVINDVTIKKFNYYLVYYSQHPLVSSVNIGSIADSLGIKKGDCILGIDSITLQSTSHLFYQGSERIGVHTNLKFARANKDGNWDYFDHSFVMPSKYPIAGMNLAMSKQDYIDVMQYVEDSVRNEHNAAKGALNITSEVIKGTASSYLPDNNDPSTISSQQAGPEIQEDDDSDYGIVGIVKIFPKEWLWPFWWYVVAMFSIGVAIFNLLPIPGLDGGQAIFCLLEIILRRKLNEDILGWINGISWVLLIIWIIWSNIKGMLGLF